MAAFAWTGEATDWSGLGGVGKRKASAVATLVPQAFDPASGADDAARKRAVLDLRALLVGEGAHTTAGAALVGPLLDLGAGGAAPLAYPEGLFALALDLVWGSIRPSARGLEPKHPALRKGAGRATVEAVRERTKRLVAALGSPAPAVRGGAALVLGSVRAADAAARAAIAQAIDREGETDVLAALLVALGQTCGSSASPDELGRFAAHRGSDHAAEVRLAAAVATVAALGDEAPAEAHVLVPALLDVAPDARGFALPARLGTMGVLAMLEGPRGRRAATSMLLARIDAELRQPLDPRALSRVLGELGVLLSAHLGEPSGAARPPVRVGDLDAAARGVVERTLHPALRRGPFQVWGLGATTFERRRLLHPDDVLLDREVRPGRTIAQELSEGGGSLDPITSLRASEEAWSDGAARLDGLVRPDSERVLAFTEACEPEAARIWAREHLARRERWPGATRAPNGPIALAALLVLGRADPAELERVWIADHEPVLAALTCEIGPLVLELLGLLPRHRRIDAWQRHADSFPNAKVGLERALALAPVCPFPEVAGSLVGRAVQVSAAGLPAALEELAAVLEAFGGEAGPARAALARVAQAAGR